MQGRRSWPTKRPANTYAVVGHSYLLPARNKSVTVAAMTRSQFLAKYPRASEAVIRLNCDPTISKAPIAPQKPVKAKQSPKERHSRVPRTRNEGTWTEAAYWGHLRSSLRRTFRFWKPALAALQAARVRHSGPRGQKWAYLCSDCGKLSPRKDVQVDHIVPVGQLTAYEHVGEFLRRLTPEDPKSFAVRCRVCHQAKTNAERATYLRPKKKSQAAAAMTDNAADTPR